MKSCSLFLIFSIILFGVQLSKAQSQFNRQYADSVEQKINRIINNLQIETALQGSYEKSNLMDRLKYYHTPGISIAIINEEKIEWARGFGLRDLMTKEPVDENTLFQAGSVSKPVFAMGVLMLKYQDKIDLDNNINEYLTSWEVPSNDTWQPIVTLRRILSHTAGFTVYGFPGYMTSEEIPTVPQILNGEYPANTAPVKVNILPGSRSRYSGGGFTVAQLAVTDHFQKPFPEIMDEILFSPLKLKNSTYEQPIGEDWLTQTATGHPWKNQPVKGRHHVYPEMAAAGLWTTPSDLATLAVEIQKASRGESNLIPKKLVDEMFTPQVVEEAIGLGFWLSNEGDSIVFEHDGDDEGFITIFAAYRYLGKGAVIMINSNEGENMIYELLRAIAEEYNWPDNYKTDQITNYKININLLSQFVGSYKSDNNLESQILIIHGELYLRYLNQSPVKLEAQSNAVFSSPLLNLSLEFEREVAKVISFSLTQGGSTLKFFKLASHSKIGR